MENKELNLVKILKDCPQGTKLYSPLFGVVDFYRTDEDGAANICVAVNANIGNYQWFRSDGAYSCGGLFSRECMLYPSKDNRDWGTFECPKPKIERFDPSTLSPFERVLARQDDLYRWGAQLFSACIGDAGMGYNVYCVSDMFTQVIPYNDDTKHLLGTFDKAPEYYRYWADYGNTED